MEFTKQFTEAAQNAILRKIEADQWENMPWLAKLVQQKVTMSLTEKLVVDCKGMTAEQLNAVLKSQGEPPIFNDDFSKLSEHIPYQTVGDVEEEQFDPCERAADEKPAEYFQSDVFDHTYGYDWQIVVIDRMKNAFNSWAIHFGRMPTQEEFSEQFKHFEARTHYVHVNEWRGGKWISITDEFNGKNSPTEEVKESFTATEEWPNMKTHRIKFWDQRINAYNYVYFEHHPGGIVLRKYHSTKCYAVVQKRPEGV